MMMQQSPQQESNGTVEVPVPPVVVAAPSVAEQLAAHPSEPELLGVRPRPLKRAMIGSDLVITLLMPMMALNLWDTLHSHRGLAFQIIMLIVSVGGLSFGIGSWISETKQAMRRKALLRHGNAVPAIITGARKATLGLQIEYTYRASHGDIRVKSLTVSTTSIPKGMHIGSTFTALVAPDDAQKVMPYFLAGEYRIDLVP